MQQQLENWLRLQLEKIENAVYDVPGDVFVSIEDSVLISDLIAQFEVIPPHFRLDQKTIDSLDENTARGRYTIVRVIVPIEGAARILPQHPKDDYLIGDVAIEMGQLFLRHSTQKAAMGQIEVWIGQDLNVISRWESTISRLIEEYHSQVRRGIERTVAARRLTLAHVEQMVTRLGIPLQRSAPAVSEVAVPVTHRSSPAKSLPHTATPQPTEYFLPEDEYTYILDVLSRMVAVMERTPRTFVKLVRKEEELRDILLVMLNGHYEIGATGETFSDRVKPTSIFRAKASPHS